MFAVFQTGGKQYRVAAGDVVSIEKYPAAVGDQIEITPLLFLENDQEVVTDPEQLQPAKVIARVLAQGKNKKIVVFKKKRRKNYRRTQGHRQAITRLQIVEIVPGRSEDIIHGA